MALWLHSEVHEGGVFTKASLRDAFPEVEQVDRRMRDLRPEGWVISTYREDRSLAPDELRLVRLGGFVWEPDYRSQKVGGLTDRERNAVLAGDNFRCLHCGIAAGESYPDDKVRTAKLTIARARGHEDTHMTLCDRCHVTNSAFAADTTIDRDIFELPEPSRRRFEAWILHDRRDWTPEEMIWARFRRLPSARRQAIREKVTRQ